MADLYGMVFLYGKNWEKHVVMKFFFLISKVWKLDNNLFEHRGRHWHFYGKKMKKIRVSTMEFGECNAVGATVFGVWLFLDNS